MKTIDLQQGSPEWHAHRATHFNASDAPAMMGCSKYKTRAQLLHELHTGLTPEVDAAQQRRFDDGHRFENLARPLAVETVGENLYPVVGVEGELSASFDGLTMDESIAFEHKTLNDELRAAMTSMDGSCLPLAYRVQMEQQCLVSGCEKVLFMATKWERNHDVPEDHPDAYTLVERREAWYLPDQQLRAQIVAGWAQLAQDLAAYVPPAATVIEKVVAEPVEALPAPYVQVTGELTLQDNFKLVEERLRDFFANRLIRAPKTDEDFVNLDAQIKAMKEGREAIKSAKAQMLAQVQPVDMANKAADALDKLLQQNCKMAEDLMAAEKERRRGEIVAAGVSALREHVEALNHKMRPTFSRVGVSYMPVIPADFGAAIKGKRSLTSMEEAVDHELARAKVAANEIASRIQLNLATLRERASELAFLFPDTAQIVLKAPDDFATLVTARIAEHRAKEQARIEAERDRIRKEEAERAERELAARTAAATPPASTPITASAAVTPQPTTASSAPAAAPAPTVIPLPQRTQPAAGAVPTLSIGAINERLQYFTLTAEGLRGLGFEPAGRERAAPRYHEADFPHMLAAIVGHVQAIQAKQAA